MERHFLPSLYAIFFCKELCLFHQFHSIRSRSQPFILALKSSTESIEKVNTFWYYHLQGNPSQSKLLLRYFMQCMQKKSKKRSQIFRYSICFSRKGTQGLFTDLPWNTTLCTYAAFLQTLFDILHFGLFYPLLLKPAKLFSAAKYKDWYNMTFSTDTR